jgi:hypothetical protein
LALLLRCVVPYTDAMGRWEYMTFDMKKPTSEVS